MKPFARSLWILALSTLILLLFGESIFAQTGCVIKLKNGQQIKSSHCYEEGDRIFVNRFGGYVAMPKSEVEEIASADIPSPAPAPAAAQKVPVEKADRAGKPKKEKVEPTEKEKLDKEIRTAEMVLKESRNSQLIYCGKAAEATAKVTPGPNLPGANVSRVSEQTAQAFQKSVQGQVEAHRANESCEYYMKRIPKLEANLEELKQKRELMP